MTVVAFDLRFFTAKIINNMMELPFCNYNETNKNIVFLQLEKNKSFFMKIKTFIIAAVALLVALSGFGQNKKYKSIYDISVKDIKGNDVSLADYKGKVLLIVNVASKCGLTPQYEGLEDLYQKYKDQGLEILAFPCNQFLEQEPGTNEEIQNFCSVNYNVTFPLFDKIDVNGKKESPLYTFLKSKAPFTGYPEGYEAFAAQLDMIHQKTGSGFEKGNAIKWNFGKFLVSKDGQTILRFEPMVSPEMLEEAIQEMLR